MGGLLSAFGGGGAGGGGGYSASATATATTGDQTSGGKSFTFGDNIVGGSKGLGIGTIAILAAAAVAAAFFAFRKP